MEIILKVKDLYKVFGESKENETIVLKGVSLEIKEGEFVAIMGHSGAGKSTLLYNISGMDRLTSGKVLFAGEDISSLSDEEVSKLRLHRMGFVFQNPHFLKMLSIKENIMLPGIKAEKKSQNQVINDTNKLMGKVGIEQIGGNDITKVSGGQLQRAAVCRALINEPDIIYGDEPTGALNSGASHKIMNILNDINKTGTTISIVTHNSKVAARADRVIYLSDGNIEAKYSLGKYNRENDDLKEREVKMHKWLKARGF